ncbi:MAG TPA: AbrB/MazE/SpoVT family DNA-binding domain-containing protein [Candidatus Nanoarchaeia archaeon]|nr:AbrB/MazE/SpoVT family DNA-binding domain-containing protein [Candidatus Nanoarchaeia archaeon]
MLVCTTKKWGNSVGIRIPKKVAEALDLKEEQEIIVEIRKKENPLRELFGALKFDEPTEKILKEIRKGESKYI